MYPLCLTKFREEDEKSESESPSEAEEDLGSELASSGDDDPDPVPAVRSYAALMQSFTVESAPQAKRRKLNQAPNEVEFQEDEDFNDAADADEVEEAEEGPETATDGLLEVGDEKEDLEDASDPFEAHFADPDDNLLAQRLKSLQDNHWATQKLLIPKFGKVVISIAQKEELKISAVLVSGPADLKLKQKLAAILCKQCSSFDDLEKHIASPIFNYQDILYCERLPENAESLRRLVCLHAVNHIFKFVTIPPT